MRSQLELKQTGPVRPRCSAWRLEVWNAAGRLITCWPCACVCDGNTVDIEGPAGCCRYGCCAVAVSILNKTVFLWNQSSHLESSTCVSTTMAIAALFLFCSCCLVLLIFSLRLMMYEEFMVSISFWVYLNCSFILYLWLLQPGSIKMIVVVNKLLFPGDRIGDFWGGENMDLGHKRVSLGKKKEEIRIGERIAVLSFDRQYNFIFIFCGDMQYN